MPAIGRPTVSAGLGDRRDAGGGQMRQNPPAPTALPNVDDDPSAATMTSPPSRDHRAIRGDAHASLEERRSLVGLDRQDAGVRVNGRLVAIAQVCDALHGAGDARGGAHRSWLGRSTRAHSAPSSIGAEGSAAAPTQSRRTPVGLARRRGRCSSIRRTRPRRPTWAGVRGPRGFRARNSSRADIQTLSPSSGRAGRTRCGP